MYCLVKGNQKGKNSKGHRFSPAREEVFLQFLLLVAVVLTVLWGFRNSWNVS